MIRRYNLKNYNFILLALVLTASIFGLVMINSADSDYTLRQGLGIAGEIHCDGSGDTEAGADRDSQERKEEKGTKK